MVPRRAILGALVLAGGARTAMADWDAIPRAQLLEKSAIIAFGTFLGAQVVRLQPDAPPLHIGVLQVTQVTKGPPDLRTVLLQLPPPRPAGLMISDDVMPRPGQTGLWYLRQVAEGLYAADHPSRFELMAKPPAR